MNIFSLCTCPESQLLLEMAGVWCNYGHFCSLAGTEALFPRGGLVLRVPGGWLLPAHGRCPSLPLHWRGSPIDSPQHTEWLSWSNLVGSITFPVIFGVKRTERWRGVWPSQAWVSSSIRLSASWCPWLSLPSWPGLPVTSSPLCGCPHSWTPHLSIADPEALYILTPCYAKRSGWCEKDSA